MSLIEKVHPKFKNRSMKFKHKISKSFILDNVHGTNINYPQNI